VSAKGHRSTAATCSCPRHTDSAQVSGDRVRTLRCGDDAGELRFDLLDGWAAEDVEAFAQAPKHLAARGAMRSTGAQPLDLSHGVFGIAAEELYAGNEPPFDRYRGHANSNREHMGPVVEHLQVHAHRLQPLDLGSLHEHGRRPNRAGRVGRVVGPAGDIEHNCHPGRVAPW
jgi:hypothetical protein